MPNKLLDAAIKGGSRIAATPKMKCFVIIANRFQLLTNITKCSILDVVAILDTPLAMVSAIKNIAKTL